MEQDRVNLLRLRYSQENSHEEMAKRSQDILSLAMSQSGDMIHNILRRYPSSQSKEDESISFLLLVAATKGFLIRMAFNRMRYTSSDSFTEILIEQLTEIYEAEYANTKQLIEEINGNSGGGISDPFAYYEAGVLPQRVEEIDISSSGIVADAIARQLYRPAQYNHVIHYIHQCIYKTVSQFIKQI